jgi:hypothetical protein
MMPNVRDASFLAEKWQRNAQNAAPNYTLGVQNPKKNWAEETAKAEDRWAQGVQDAINRKAFGSGVRKAGVEAWQQGAVQKGSQRYPQGVALAKETWQREWEPYRQVIQNTRLPDRGPKGAPQNYERVRAMGEALRQEKLRRQAGGAR